MKRGEVSKRSSMQVTLITRLVSVTLTIFILILTLKSELLDYKVVTWQLVLAIPLLFVALVANSKILNAHDFKEHKTFVLLINSVSFALVYNTIGLLATKYVSALLGMTYFILFILCYSYFLKKDWKHGQIQNELIIIILLVLLGLVPAIIVLT